MRRFLQLGLAALSLTALCNHADAGTYKIDPAKSQLVVQVFKEGVAARLAHDHVIQATQYSGQVTFDPAAPNTGAISVEVKTNTLKADDAALRKKYGLPEGPDADGAKDIEANMKAEGQLNTAKYPTISFQSTNIAKQPNGQYTVTGNLTLHGKTQPVTFPATVEMQGANFHGKGQIKFKTSTFGVEPYSAMLGAIKNQDGVILHIDIVATP